MPAEQIGKVTLNDEHAGMLSEIILCGCPLTKAETQKELQLYWSFRDEIAIIDDIAISIKLNNNTYITARQSTKTATNKPLRNREDKTAAT